MSVENKKIVWVGLSSSPYILCGRFLMKLSEEKKMQQSRRKVKSSGAAIEFLFCFPFFSLIDISKGYIPPEHFNFTSMRCVCCGSERERGANRERDLEMNREIR